MDEALKEARKAFDEGEVPIGAGIARGPSIICAAHNQIEQLQDATAHAEILAIREASRLTANWRLGELILCVTVEPCAMCLGAARLARVGAVVYGAEDSRFGALRQGLDILNDSTLGPVPEVIGPVRAAEGRSLMQEFFRKSRGG
jgi:tRNA(adenine34) deaminase